MGSLISILSSHKNLVPLKSEICGEISQVVVIRSRLHNSLQVQAERLPPFHNSLLFFCPLFALPHSCSNWYISEWPPIFVGYNGHVCSRFRGQETFNGTLGTQGGRCQLPSPGRYLVETKTAHFETLVFLFSSIFQLVVFQNPPLPRYQSVVSRDRPISPR